MSKVRKKVKRLSMKCIEKNIDEIMAVAEKEGIAVNPTAISSRQTVYECPYKECSMEFNGAAQLLRHLTTHKPEENCTTLCPFCEKHMNNLTLVQHLENSHPELDVKRELEELNSSINPTHKSIRESLKSEQSSKRLEVATKMNAFLVSSIFEASSSSMPFAEFRSSLRRKLIENTKANVHLIFKFLTRRNALEWGCLLCSENEGLTFKNPISLRLHALFHLEKHVNDEHFEHLLASITKEWNLLMKDSPTLPLDKIRASRDLSVGRSFLSYCLLRDNDSVGEAMDVIDKCHLDGAKNRNALCLLCHSPFLASLSSSLDTPKHFQVDSHLHLKAKGWSEFREVDEIAQIPHGEERDVQSALLFSSFTHLSNEKEAAPKKLFKWRCTLCSLDVAVFPSSISLRFFALRHLERDHPCTLSEGFYRHEWSLLQMETSLVNMRRFSLNEHIAVHGKRPIDITDPSDFLFPWQRVLRVPSPDYFVCGHCFFVSTEGEIRDHLATHGFVEGDGCRRIVLEDGGQEVMIDEKTIRKIRKNLSVPSSILYDASMSEREEQERTPPPTTPPSSNNSKIMTALTDTPKSKYKLRARSITTRYAPIGRDEETMSSAESDSGHEKNYQMPLSDTMDDEFEERERRLEKEMKPPKMRLGSSGRKRNSLTPMRTKAATASAIATANTCTESSVYFDDLYTTEIVAAPSGEREEGGMTMWKRETDKVHEKAFCWEGEDPPALSVQQIELIREFREVGRCRLCPKGRGYRGVGKMTNVEQSMVAHHIVHHYDDLDAMAVVTRKRFLLAKSLSTGGVEPVPPFLLQSVHKNYLTCSRCMEFKCARQSNLAVHWESCTGVKGNRWRTANEKRVVKEEKVEEERPKTISVRCPICREGWRKSVHYSDDVSVAIHLLLKHTTEERAYAMAIQLEEETNMQSAFPWIHITASFALRAEHPESGIQCAQCTTNSVTLAAAIRHATRAHATSKEKREANFTSGSLSCPLPSSSCTLKSVLLGRPRSIPAIHFLHVLFYHSKDEEEAVQFMQNISQEDMDALRAEANLRLDVDESIKRWLASVPRLICALCAQSSCTWPVHMNHFEERDCGEEDDKLSKTECDWRKARTPSRKLNPRMSLLKAKLDQQTPPTVTSTARGRGKAPDAAMNCPHCPKKIFASSKYASSVSMDLHLLTMHNGKEMITSPSTFPFIDFSRSSPESLQCSHCEYTAKESRYVIDHAWTKHPEESHASEGDAALAEFEASVKKKREKQRVSCARPLKRLREKMRLEEEGGDGEKEEEEEGVEKKKKRVDEEEKEEEPSVSTPVARIPRQRSTVSRWLDTSQTEASIYSPSTRVDDDLRERLDRLFSGGVDSPSSQQPVHGSSSIFKELPETEMSKLQTKSRAEDISHIKGLEGVRCSVCTFKGRNTEALRIHFNEAHQEVSFLSAASIFPCAVCSKVFPSKRKWRCHCEEDHRPQERPFQCFKCEFRYETHQKLRAHQIRVHESEILVHPDDRTCVPCNRLFGSLRAYQEHKKRHESRMQLEEEDDTEE